MGWILAFEVDHCCGRRLYKDGNVRDTEQQESRDKGIRCRQESKRKGSLLYIHAQRTLIFSTCMYNSPALSHSIFRLDYCEKAGQEKYETIPL